MQRWHARLGSLPELYEAPWKNSVRSQNALFRRLRQAYGMLAAASVLMDNLPERHVIKVIRNKPAYTPYPFLYRANDNGKFSLVGRATPAMMELNAVNLEHGRRLRQVVQNARAMLSALVPAYKKHQMPVLPSKTGALLRQLDRAGLLGKYVYVIGDLGKLAADLLEGPIDRTCAGAVRRNRTVQLLVAAGDQPPYLMRPPADTTAVKGAVPAPGTTIAEAAYQQRQIAIVDYLNALCATLNAMPTLSAKDSFTAPLPPDGECSCRQGRSRTREDPGQLVLFDAAPAATAQPSASKEWLPGCPPAARRLRIEIECLPYDIWHEHHTGEDAGEGLAGAAITQCFLTTDRQFAPVVALDPRELPQADE
jgi:hypothetical protein